MKDEYDLSRAERGRFSDRRAVLVPPLHLDADVEAFLKPRAEARGLSLNDFVNALLKEGIARIEAAE